MKLQNLCKKMAKISTNGFQDFMPVWLLNSSSKAHIFILLNLLIATITFIISYRSNKNNGRRKLNRAPSYFNRLCSFTFSSYETNQIYYRCEEEDMQQQRTLSEMEEIPIVKDEVCNDMEIVPAPRAMERVGSLRGDAEVDAKADDFINRFKQQLRMQRLESIRRYSKGMPTWDFDPK